MHSRQNVRRHSSTSLGQQPQWAHCCVPQRRQWGVPLANKQQQGSSTVLQWNHQDAVVARKLMAQQQRPPPVQQGHVLGALAALPVLAVGEYTSPLYFGGMNCMPAAVHCPVAGLSVLSATAFAAV